MSGGYFDFSSMGTASIHGTFATAPIGIGRLTPRLIVPITVDVRGGTDLRLDNMSARLLRDQEVVGTAGIAGVRVGNAASQVQLEFATSTRMLTWVTEQLGPGHQFTLNFELRGSFRYRPTGAADGQMAEGNLGMAPPAYLTVTRSDWFERVLKPTSGSDFVYLEVPVSLDGHGSAWVAAVRNLREAESAFATGDDAAVFTHLRAALDSFPGAKQHIFAAVPHARKRAAVDDLVKEYGDFLNVGRHVDIATGDDNGAWPQDRIDASFAISTMKVLLSYAAVRVGRKSASA